MWATPSPPLGDEAGTTILWHFVVPPAVQSVPRVPPHWIFWLPLSLHSLKSAEVTSALAVYYKEPFRQQNRIVKKLWH